MTSCGGATNESVDPRQPGSSRARGTAVRLPRHRSHQPCRLATQPDRLAAAPPARPTRQRAIRPPRRAGSAANSRPSAPLCGPAQPPLLPGPHGRVASLPRRTTSLPPLRLVRATAGDPTAQARRLSRQTSALSAPRKVIATASPRHRMPAVLRSRRVTSRLRSGRRASRRSTMSNRSAGTTSTTASAGIGRTRQRPVRISSSDGSYGSASVSTRSTVPRPPPASEKPTQLASQ